MLQSITHTRSASSRPDNPQAALWRKVADALAKAGRTIALWVERYKQRKALADLDDHILKDIGVSREEAVRESAVPFWR